MSLPSSSSSYIDVPAAVDLEEVDNLTSDSSTSDLPSDGDDDDEVDAETIDEYISDAEQEWRESLQQLELLLTMVLVPYLGKYFGRRCAYWGWARFMEWKYPVSVEVTSPTAFKGAGAVAAAASL